MRLIDRYIVREVGGLLLFGVGVFTSLLMVNELYFLARLAGEAAVPLRTNLTLLALRVPYAVSYSLPMATLLACLLAFGRLSDRNEITAMRTSGWSLGRVTVPAFFAGALVAVAALAIGEWVVPQTQTRYSEVFAAAVRAPARPLQRNVMFREPVDGVESVFFAREADTQAGVMRRVVITQFHDGRPVRLIEAETAAYGPRGWVLERGAIYLIGEGGITTRFEEMRVALARTPRQIAAARRDPSEMTIRELRQQVAALQAAGESAIRYAVSLHAKIALPTSSLIFTLLAVPLGLRQQRSGRSTGLGLTVLVLLGYYFMMSITLSMGERGRLAPFWAAWMPNIAAAGAGGYLLWHAR